MHLVQSLTQNWGLEGHVSHSIQTAAKFGQIKPVRSEAFTRRLASVGVARSPRS